MPGIAAAHLSSKRRAPSVAVAAHVRGLALLLATHLARALALSRDPGPIPLRPEEGARFGVAGNLHPGGSRPGDDLARRDAFGELFARYSAPLANYLYGMTRDRELSADLVQETFARALAATNDLAAIAYPQAWLYRIATNLALTTLGRRRRFGWLPLSHVEPESAAASSGRWSIPPLPDQPYADLAATIAERDAVWGVLAELPPRWRAILLMQTTAGFEVREIATLLRLSEANVRKILFRAKERFRELHAQAEQPSPKGGGAR